MAAAAATAAIAPGFDKWGATLVPKYRWMKSRLAAESAVTSTAKLPL